MTRLFSCDYFLVKDLPRKCRKQLISEHTRSNTTDLINNFIWDEQL